MAQIAESKWKSLQYTADYKGEDFTTSFTMGNPDLLSWNGMGILHYLQSVTPKLALGAELAYQAAPQIPGNNYYGSYFPVLMTHIAPGGQIGVLSVCGRYTASDFTFSSTLSNSGALHACYYQKCSPDLSVGAELETNLRMGAGESRATVGYKVEIPRAGLNFKGSVNSDWEVTAVMEKKLLPIPFSLALCGMINHPKNSFMMGAGLIIG